MNFVDVILGIFILAFLINGIKKGFISSVVHLLGLIVAVFLIGKIGYDVRIALMEKFTISETIATIIAYIIIFLVIMLIAKIVIIILHKIVTFLSLKFLDRILGAIFGILNGILILAILLIILDISPISKIVAQGTENSKISSFVRIFTGKAYEKIPQLEEGKDKLEEIIEKVTEKI